MTSGVLCAGRLYCDLVFTGVPRLPTMGTEVYASGLSLHAGGGAFITAAHLGALGARAGLAAYLPSAPFDVALLDALNAAQLDLSLCRPDPSGTDPQVTVAMVGAADRAFLTRRGGAALPKLTRHQMKGYRHLHIGELATLAEEPWLLTQAHQAGLTVSADCAWDENLPENTGDLIAQLDLLLPNESEMGLLAQLGITPHTAGLTVVKNGPDGATAFSDVETLDMPTTPRTPVDTTGAGDAFNAGFLQMWLKNAPLDACLKAGNTAAGRAIMHVGGFVPQPSAGAAPAYSR